MAVEGAIANCMAGDDEGRISKRARSADPARCARLLRDRGHGRHLRRRRGAARGADGQQLHLGLAGSAAAARLPAQEGGERAGADGCVPFRDQRAADRAAAGLDHLLDARSRTGSGARPGRAARRARRSSRSRSACSNASASRSMTAATTTSWSARSSRRASTPALDPAALLPRPLPPVALRLASARHALMLALDFVKANRETVERAIRDKGVDARPRRSARRSMRRSAR